MLISPREYFRSTGKSPRKRFGQHFLTQLKTAERIVELAELSPSDAVVEVGPGLGALTRFILPKVRRLHLVELDRDLAAFLQTNLPSEECRVSITQQDILNVDLCAFVEKKEERLVVLGNLPYNVSSPLVFRLLEFRHCIRRAVLMVQREVGDRLASLPGGKDYGVLSVLLGVYARVQSILVVGPGQFYPPPNVDSVVVSIDFIETLPSDLPPFPFLRRLVNTCFQQRRKTLLNSLRGLVGQDSVLAAKVLEAAHIDSQRRPETLSPAEFVLLAKSLEVLSAEC
jgi:16S rRNA (adenine1518-N6/adenine1519-N6)-dimethyltransferase